MELENFFSVEFISRINSKNYYLREESLVKKTKLSIYFYT
jgi:hypothetical protein